MRTETATQRDVRLADVDHLILMGSATVTTPLLHALFRQDVPVSWHDGGGWLLGHTLPPGGHRARARLAQMAMARDGEQCLAAARALVAARIANGRQRLRQRRAAVGRSDADTLARCEREAWKAPDADTLRGIEGTAGAAWFRAWAAGLRPPGRGDGRAFRFAGRNRRPPRDPVNSLLSYAYGVLAGATAMALQGEGLEPGLGVYHATHAGRPSLALDMMEPFRPVVADSAVQAVINEGRVRGEHFTRDGDGGLQLAPEARRALLAAFETAMDRRVRPGWLHRATTPRHALHQQARNLARTMTGDRDAFTPFRLR